MSKIEKNEGEKKAPGKKPTFCTFKKGHYFL